MLFKVMSIWDLGVLTAVQPFKDTHCIKFRNLLTELRIGFGFDSGCFNIFTCPLKNFSSLHRGVLFPLKDIAFILDGKISRKDTKLEFPNYLHPQAKIHMLISKHSRSMHLLMLFDK